MGTVRVSVEIDATPGVVWGAIETIERHVDWMADAESIRFTSDRHAGIGTTFVCRTRVGPLRLDDAMEITEWAPGAAMGVAHTGLISGRGRFSLTPIDLGRRTRFEWHETLRFPWFLGGPLGAHIAGRFALGPIWRRNLRGLKALIEVR